MYMCASTACCITIWFFTSRVDTSLYLTGLQLDSRKLLYLMSEKQESHYIDH